jgi:hypothetical protein
MAETNRGAKPSKLGHVGFGTSQFDAMKQWWQVALGACVIHENEDMALLSYDDEPTRVAIVRNSEARAGERGGPADHVAFEFSCLADLLGRYEALCEQGTRTGTRRSSTYRTSRAPNTCSLRSASRGAAPARRSTRRQRSSDSAEVIAKKQS